MNEVRIDPSLPVATLTRSSHDDLVEHYPRNRVAGDRRRKPGVQPRSRRGLVHWNLDPQPLVIRLIEPALNGHVEHPRSWMRLTRIENSTASRPISIDRRVLYVATSKLRVKKNWSSVFDY